MIEIVLSTATQRRPFLPFLPLTVRAGPEKSESVRDSRIG